MFAVLTASVGVDRCNAEAAKTIAWESLELRATDGGAIAIPKNRFTVIAFLGTECPLARLYGPRLQKIANEFADRGVGVLGVISNVQDSPSEIDAYAKQHQLRFAIAKDSDQSIADAFGASRTPEVFLIDGSGTVRYQGRIDDQYEPGIARSEPTRRDLRRAISDLLAGEPVQQPVTPGVGCLITRFAKPKVPDLTENVATFNRDVAPILHKHCVECHRSGEIAPMELTDYDEVVGWAQMILEVIDQKRMPPWHADPDIGHFVGARHLPERDRNKIAAWIEAGMPAGDPADLPRLTHSESSWQFATEPDEVFPMRASAFDVPADGVVEYQYFVVDPGWREDRWIRAAQVVPGNSSVVHHAIVFVRPPDGSDFAGIGWMGAYVPGQRATELPPGHARLVPAGSKLIFQMHYTPNGRPTEDRTRIAVWMADADRVTHEVMTRFAIDHQFEIPPNESDFTVAMSVNAFPRRAKMLGIMPHMHLRGKSFELFARDADESTRPLLRVPHYDFNWQHWYQFSDPVDLGSVAALEMNVVFDNSTSNPFNPAPQEHVSWGDQTWEEMAIAFFDVAIPRGSPRYRADPPKPLSAAEAGKRKRQIELQTMEFFRQMDSDGNGIIEREEAPESFRRFGFSSVDRNHDGQIERDEVRTVAAENL